MTKNKILPGCYVFPTPVVLIGANVNAKPNFNAIGWVCALEFGPPLISISSNQQHYNNIGIKENQTFSVNTPSVDMVEISDYCGMKSGKKVDKSELFDVFYGELKTAPMIKEAPLNLECKVIHTVDTTEIANAKNGHDIFIGEVVQAYAEDKYLTKGALDVAKINPFVLSNSMNKMNYYKIGEEIGRAWRVGRNYKKE
ncbi:MAG: flavin reductase family protein [Promethearchaeota archaeon]|nr:MAG: flavin reductase family protein [Candidatus Lokiarchaeota archaeon]